MADRSNFFWFAFWALAGIVWLSFLGTRALIHPDEGRYATLSLGILQSHDWITPRLNGFLYFEKPVLQYWAGALSFHLFGLNDFAARLWPGLTGLLTVAVVHRFSVQLWGQDVGRLAAVIAAGTTWIVGSSHFLTLDMGVTFFLTLALCSFLLAQDDRTEAVRRRRLMWLCWSAMAGATLSKGLIGVLIPAMTLFLYSVLHRDWSLWRRMHWFSGVALYLALAAPWFILVAARNPGFADFFFVHEHFQRFLTTEHRREGAAWYFIPVLLAGFFPWTSLIGHVLRTGWTRAGTPLRARRLLSIWCAFTFVFFSASGSKLPSYILPMFPPMAMLLALALERMPAAILKKHLLLPALAFAGLFAAYPLAGRFTSAPLPVMQSLALSLAVCGAVGLAGTALAWQALTKNRQTQAMAILAMTVIVAVGIGMNGHDSFGRLKSSKWIAGILTPYLRPDTEVFSVRTYDQTFPYYLRRPVTLVDYGDEFTYGETAEPQRWIPALPAFIRRWNAAPSAIAMMTAGTYETLAGEHLPMRVVYQDARRLVVVKP